VARVLRTRATRREDGAAAVEFALVVPILFLLLFGIIQYGLYFYAYQGGSDAGRSAARMAGVGNPPGCTAFKAAVTSEVNDYVGDDSSLVITRTYQNDAGTTIPAASVQIGDFVVVGVNFEAVDLKLPIPFIKDGKVETTSRSRVEYLNNGAVSAC
jgi:Flp pilus assembly protein TadG